MKSYVIRASRMSPSQKRAYEELFPIWGLRDEVVDWQQLFPGTNRRVVEIGFGMGEATWQVAAAHPDWGILGIEVHPPGVGKLLWWIEKQNLTNIRILCDDAAFVFRKHIPHNSVDAIHLWFPDPWPKKKHHKRRLINAEFVNLLAHSMRGGGVIHAATDWEPYAEFILETLEKEPKLKNCHETWAPRPDTRPYTKFEQKGIDSDRVIHDIIFQKA